MTHPEEDVRAFVGPNADYYLAAWAKADPNGGLQALRWNWPAFFLSVVWLLYRRMYKYFWITFAALIGIGMIQALLEAILNIPPERHWLDVVVNLIVASFFGTFGSWLYYRHTMWTIGQVKAYHTSPEAIARAGGVRWLWPVMILGAAVLLGILAAMMMPGLAHQQ